MSAYSNSRFIRLPPDGTGKKVRATQTIEFNFREATNGGLEVNDHISLGGSPALHGYVTFVHDEGDNTGVAGLRLHDDHSTIPSSIEDGYQITVNGQNRCKTNGTTFEVMYVNAAVTVGGNNPFYSQSVDAYGAAISRFTEGSPQFDASGMIRQSNMKLLGSYDYASVADSFGSLSENGGSVTYNTTERAVVISTTGSVGSKVILQTHKYHAHSPGTPNYFQWSMKSGDAGKANHRKRFGAFDDKYGVFFEISGTTLSVVYRNSTTGSVVDTVTDQTDWNEDTVAASGVSVSKFRLAIDKINEYWVDVQSSGGGLARFGIITDRGVRVLVHETRVNNTSVTPFLDGGALPLRFEIEDFGASGSSSELKFYGAMVTSNGAPLELSGKFYEACVDAPVTNNSTSTWKPLLSLRPKPTIEAGTVIKNDFNPSSYAYVSNDVVRDTSDGRWYKCILGYTSTATTPANDATHWSLADPYRGTLLPIGFSFIANDPVDVSKPQRAKIEIFKNATLTDATWSKNKGDAQVDVAATAMTGGSAVAEWVVWGSLQPSDTDRIFRYLDTFLSNNFDGSSVTLTIGIKPLVNAQNVEGIAVINWEQFDIH